MKTVYLLGGARTAFGSFGGVFKDVDATTLGVAASQGALAKSGVDPGEVDLAVTGNVIHTSSNASYLARHIALHAGVPIASPALTVNRLCGSGLQAVVSAAQSLMLGEGEVALTSGAENMSQSPHVLRGARFGTKLTSPQIDDMLLNALTDAYKGTGMGITAENLAKKYHISREEQDEFALRSQQRAAHARATKIFAEEIVPVEVKTRKGLQQVTEDEHIREQTTREALASLKPAFLKEGTVTSGNASGINDGAAALVIATEDYVTRTNKTPLGRIVSWGIAGVDPEIMGIGPVPAIQKALQQANLSIDQIDLVEINEAFAAQFLAVTKEIDLDPDKTNVHGGAIALGHPVGASGARILHTLLLELKRRQGRYGLASLCIGGGQGIAMVVESY